MTQQLHRLAALAEQLPALLMRLQMAEIASCNCHTQTDEEKYHDATCLYRVIRETAALLVALMEESRIVLEIIEQYEQHPDEPSIQAALQQVVPTEAEQRVLERALQKTARIIHPVQPRNNEE